MKNNLFAYLKKLMVVRSRNIILLFIGGFLLPPFSFAKISHGSSVQYEILDIPLTAQNEHEWWKFPVEINFIHAESGTRIKQKGFWNGEKNWVIRFSPTLEGSWTYTTSSSDPGLDNVQGTLNVRTPSQFQVNENPNYQGHVNISQNGRYFEYADGSPVFLLADTNWALNTSRCGLGNNKDGPFYQYLADRKSKKFTAILFSYMRGFGDTEEPYGQRNEGGYPFINGDTQQFNPLYFDYLDERVQAIWDHGFLAATSVTWFGKLNCFFDLTWAKRISAYLMVRYGAYNGLFSLSGEYQYALRDCGWDTRDFEEMGTLLQTYNPYKKPISIHPSGRTNWNEPHGEQSSKAYHKSSWLDHNWLQTGQGAELVFNITGRAIENYGLLPIKPVFLSEAYYERQTETDHTYYSRWQPWSAFLNGAAGYGYGAFGIWQFFDPEDSLGETGKNVNTPLPWKKALGLAGAGQMQYTLDLLTSYAWWDLVPQRDWLTINGKSNPLPTPSDITPPHCAAIPGELYIVYLPRDNSDNVIEILNLNRENYQAKWYNPRNGGEIIINDPPSDVLQWVIPERPHPIKEDWVLVLSND